MAVDAFVIEVLEHIRTYRITLPKALVNLFRLEDESEASELLDALASAGLVGQAGLTPWENYYYLEPKSAELLRLPSLDAGPLKGATRRITAYAILYFCCMEETYRPRIPPEVFRARFPELYRPGPKLNYYTEGQKLGYLRVETRESTSGDIYRLVDRCSRDVFKRTRWKGGSSPAFQQLVSSGRFVVTVLTPFQAKADAMYAILGRLRERFELYNIRAADIEKFGPDYDQTPEPAFLEYHDWRRRYPDSEPPRPPPAMEVHVVPELLDLIYPKPSQT